MRLTLQQKVLSATSSLLPAVNDKAALKEIISALKKVKIPERQYSQVLNFILLLIHAMPEILEAAPKDSKLKELCIYCADHITINPEHRTKNTPRRRS